MTVQINLTDEDVDRIASAICDRLHGGVQTNLLTIKDIMEYLSISETVARQLTTAIPYVRIGGSIRFKRADVDRYIEQHTHRPVKLKQLK